MLPWSVLNDVYSLINNNNDIRCDGHITVISKMAPDGGGMSFDLTNEHMKSVFRTMQNLRKDRLMCDIQLRVGEKVIHAHKLVLVSSIPYFYAMFTSDLVESRQPEVTLKGMDSSAVETIVDFAYTASLDVDAKNVLTLLPVASILQMNRVQRACCEFLESQLDPSNCLGIFAFAELHGCMDLKNVARNYCDLYFNQVIKHDEFLSLPVERVCWYLSHSELCVKTEVEVFNAAMQWVSHNMAERSKYIGRVFEKIRLHLLPKPFIRMQLEENDLLLKETVCREKLTLAIKDIESGVKSWSMQRVPKGATVIYSAGGYLKHSLDTLECYNSETGEWRQLCSLPRPKSGAGAAFVGGDLYLVGGRNNSANGNLDSDSVERYDPFSNEWSLMAPLSTPRNRLGIGIWDGAIYVVGGSDGMIHLNSAEVYNVEENKWTLLPAMNTRRIGVGVAVVSGILYAVGGFDSENRLRSMEAYSPDTKKWTLMAPMNTPRSGAGVAAVGGFIYAVGGYNGITQLNSAERYDPQTDQWTMIAPMHHHRSALSVAVVHDKLFALGGYDGKRFLSSVEAYDACNDLWEIVTSMSLGRSGSSVAVGILPPVQQQGLL